MSKMFADLTHRITQSWNTPKSEPKQVQASSQPKVLHQKSKSTTGVFDWLLKALSGLWGGKKSAETKVSSALGGMGSSLASQNIHASAKQVTQKANAPEGPAQRSIVLSISEATGEFMKIAYPGGARTSAAPNYKGIGEVLARAFLPGPKGSEFDTKIQEAVVARKQEKPHEPALDSVARLFFDQLPETLQQGIASKEPSLADYVNGKKEGANPRPPVEFAQCLGMAGVRWQFEQEF